MTTLSGALGGLFGRGSTDGSEHDDRTEETTQAQDENANHDTAARSTTGGGSDNGPVVVWQAPNKMEAEIVKGRLESEGIPAFLRGEALGPIIGLTSGSLAVTQVLVPYPLADKAMDLLYDSEETDADATDDESADHTGESDGTDQ